MPLIIDSIPIESRGSPLGSIDSDLGVPESFILYSANGKLSGPRGSRLWLIGSDLGVLKSQGIGSPKGKLNDPRGRRGST